MRTEALKLEHFKADIMSDVSERKRVIEEELQTKLKKDYEAKELEFLEEAYNIIQDGLKAVDREKNEVISKAAMENRVKLLHKRKEIIDEVFRRCKVKIEQYTKTEEYKDLLVSKIKDHMKLLGEGDYIIYLNYKDKDLYTFIQEKFPKHKVFFEKKHIEMIGGVKLHNTTANVYLDDSLAKRLEEEEEEFLQYCENDMNNKVGD